MMFTDEHIPVALVKRFKYFKEYSPERHLR